MPTYEFQCSNTECANEWEDFRSITAPLPECPKCDGKEVVRLISCQSKGTVELSGHELKDKMKTDAAAYRREVYSNEKTYSNLTGEAKYQSLQSSMDKHRR